MLALTVLCAVSLVAAFIWLMATTGQTRHRSGPEVGAEIMGQVMDSGDESQGDMIIPLAERRVFRGTGVAVEKEIGMGYGDIKALVRYGRWREALPWLVAMVGLAGLLAFGSLALLVWWENKLVAGFIAAVVIFTLTRIASQVARA